MLMHTRNVYHKRESILRGCDTSIILRNSQKSLSHANEPFVGPDRPVQTLRKIVSMRFIFWTVSKK
jgi:hypothetical protein